MSLNCHLSVAQKCSTQSPCSCSIDEYTTINLKDLQVPQGGFYYDGDLQNVTYFFSGCQDTKFDPSIYHLFAKTTLDTVSLVKCTSKYTNVNVTIDKKTSLVPTVVQSCINIGNAADIKFAEITSATSKEGIKYQLNYVSNQTEKHQPSIQLACNTYKRTDLKIVNAENDTLILYSPLSCVQYQAHHELSTGSVFCIIYFVVLLVYFVGGSAIMYFARGARGVEVVPNYEFWCSLPGLVRDGVIYLFNGCRPLTAASAEAYDRI